MRVCMIVPEKNVMGGIASVTGGYRGYDFGSDCEVRYVESYCDGSKGKKLMKAVGGYLAFLGELCFHRPDIVHVHSSFGPSFYRKLPFIYMASWTGRRIVNHIHGADFALLYPESSEKKRKLVQKVYGRCDIIVALSEEWKKAFSLIVPPEKIRILPNYCRIPLPKKVITKNRILFLGAFEKRKGCFDIPQIYREATVRSDKLPLVMAGDGDMEGVRKRFEESLHPLSQVTHGEAENPEAEKQEQVTFPGWVRGEAKEELLRESDIFLFPTYNEGMPMAVLEAMANEMAIVTTGVGGIPKLIEDGVSGYLCEPGNVAEIADRLAELIKDKEKRAAFGRAARKRATEQYGMEGHITELKRIYKELATQ